MARRRRGGGGSRGGAAAEAALRRATGSITVSRGTTTNRAGTRITGNRGEGGGASK